jgi:CRISPR system Cascade subunit CasE
MSLYLSRVCLNARSRRARRDVAQPYELHRTLLRAFPAAADGGPGRVLYRLDVDERGGDLTVLVQSEIAPDWAWLAAEGDYLRADVQPNPACKSWTPGFAVGQALAFRLRANPTARRDDKRVGLYGEEEQLAWLARKAEAGGFRVGGVRVAREGMSKSYRLAEDGQRQLLQLFAVRFDGVLQVVDPARFAETVAAGVGSGKGLGFGLLSLARA